MNGTTNFLSVEIFCLILSIFEKKFNTLLSGRIEYGSKLKFSGFSFSLFVGAVDYLMLKSESPRYLNCLNSSY